MTCVLRPRPSSKGSSSEKYACLNEQRYIAPQRYDDDRVRQLTSLAPQDPHNGAILAAELPRRPRGASELEGRCSNNTYERTGQLAATAIQSAGDVHKINELNSSAEVGALCVAVVCQSLKRVSLEIWGATRGGAAVANLNKSMLVGAPTPVSSTGALRGLLRRFAQAFAPRRNEDVLKHPEACLVLYCKLTSGVIMASPLDGPAFRLRQQLPIVEVEGALAGETTEAQTTTCWTLPSEGFEALLDLEKSVVPGLPALARDMANDKRLTTKTGSRLMPLAEEISVQLYHGDENRTQRIVVPRMAGIIFASLGPAAASTTSLPRGGTSVGSSDPSLRVSAVLARLEQEDDAVAHRFVLEDFDVFGDSGGGGGESCPRKRSRAERRNTKGRTRRVSLPTTYAALLEEATFPGPSPGPNIATRILGRWRRGRKYRAGVTQVVPGVGEAVISEEEHDEPFLRSGQCARIAKVTTGEVKKTSTSAETAIRAGKVQHGNSSQSEKMGGGLLSVGDVMSASSSQAERWASTREVIRAMLIAACRHEENICATPETQGSTAGSTGTSCASARRATCALLERVVGGVTAREENAGRNVAEFGGKEAPTEFFDWWYEEFCSATAPPCGGGAGVGMGRGLSPLLQREGPRLLLEEMLEIPALKAGFVKRGLARHLAGALRVGSLEMRSRESSTRCHTHVRHAPDGEAPLCGMIDLPNSDPDMSRARAGKMGGKIRPGPSCRGADGKGILPWWLLFSQGRAERGKGGQGRQGDGHGQGFRETLKEPGGSTDGVGAEADGRSCQTALDDIFTPERGKEEGGAETSRGDDPSDNNNSLGSFGAVGMPASAKEKQRECRERQEEVDGGTADGGTNCTKAWRVAPPMLRLDALGSILDKKDGASARFCSSHAVTCLSAASTRAASEHVPTFLSARGATSRASARHGSARSVRTGRTTQRDSTASTGCPTVRSTSPSAAPADQDVAGTAPPPLLSPPPSSRYGDGDEPVHRCQDGDGGTGGCEGAAAVGHDGKASAGSTIPSPAVAKARDRKSEKFAVNGCGVLHPGDDDGTAEALSALPARQGDGDGSIGREGMPRLHLEGLPANHARQISKVVEEASGGSFAGGRGPSASTITGQGCLNEPASRAQPSGACGNPALCASPETDHESTARPDRCGTANGGNLHSTDRSSTGYHVRPSEKGALQDDDANGAVGIRFENDQPGLAPVALRNDGSQCAPRDITTPASLVLNLARTSAPGWAPCLSPSQSQPISVSDAFGAETAAATLLVSLLPSTPVEHYPEESLLVALDVLSFVGTLSWIGWAEACAASKTATGADGGRPTKDPTSSCPNNVPDPLWEPKLTQVWPPELDNLDLTLLANTAVWYLDLRLSALELLFEEVSQDDGNEDTSSEKHQGCVHNSCRLVLECTWLTRLLLRSVVAAGTLDEKLRSATLSAQAAGDAMRLCTRALGMLQSCVRNMLSTSPLLVSSKGRPSIDDGGAPEVSPEILLQHGGRAAEMLLLTAPVAADLTVLLAALVRQPMAWGEDPTWAARTLGSTALGCGGVDGAAISALAELLGRLVAETPRKVDDPRQNAGSEGDRLQRPPRAHRSLPEAAETLERRLTGGRRVLDFLLIAVLDGIAAVLRRAHILMEASEDVSQGVLGSAAGAVAGKTRVERPQEEIREAVSRVVRGIECVFQPDGPVLTLLEAQCVPTSFHADGLPLCEGASSNTTMGCSLHVPLVTAALRLSTVFLSLCATAGIRDEAERGLRLEGFVSPLFSGFRARWGAFVESRSPDAVHTVPPTEGGRRVGCETRLEPEAERGGPIRSHDESERGTTSLCRLNLEALVELASTRDPAVLRRLGECRVAPFLLRRVLSLGAGTEGRRQEPLGWRDAAQRSEEWQPYPAHGSDLTAPAHQRMQQGNANRGGGGGGGGTVPEQAKPPGSAAAGCVLHAAGAPLSVGDRVDGLVSVKSGRPRWFPGRVERVNREDGTVHICYDDGDEEPHKDPGKVRPTRRIPTDRARRRLPSGAGQRDRGKGSPAAAPPSTSSAARVVRQGGKQRPGTGDTTLKPGLSPAANGGTTSLDGPRLRSTETTGEAPQSCSDWNIGKREATEVTTPGAAVAGGGRAAIVDAMSEAANLSAGNDRVREPAISSAGCSGNSAENDSEDDDAYFVIPSVLSAAPAATTSSIDNVRPCPAVDSSSLSASPVSVVPRIDLQSPVFRTRVFSSQLGPGSSLSTPTTGGGRVLDRLRSTGGSRSEASLSPSPFPNRRGSSQAPRPPSFIARSLRLGSGVTTRSAKVLPGSDPSRANPGLEGQIARLLNSEKETSSSEDEDEDNEEDGVGSPTSEAVARCPTLLVSRDADDSRTGQGHAAASITTPPGLLEGAVEMLPADEPSDHGKEVSEAAAAVTARRQSDDLRVTTGLAITLILSMATASSNDTSPGWGYSSPLVPLLEGLGEKQENDEVVRVMTRLQEYFEDDRNADIVPSLRVRWRSMVMSTAESAPAVLAKLVCAALFDSQSYPLDGSYVSAGRFGGIIVSKCPLRLSWAQRYQPPVQACHRIPSTGRREEPKTSLSLLPPMLSSPPSDSRRKVEAANTDGDDTDEVALKVVERDELDSAVGANVFAEVLALRTLTDVPGVCHLYDFGVTPTSYILVIERCVGSLKEWRLARNTDDDSGGGQNGDGAIVGTPRSDEEAVLYLLIFRQIVSTVAAMAERGVIHFDLKCENILVRNNSSTGGPPLAGSLVPLAGLDSDPYTGHDVAPSVCVADFGESTIGRRRRTAGVDASDSPTEHVASFSATDSDFFFDVSTARGTERIQSPEMVLLSGVEGGRGGRPERPGSFSAGDAREENEETAGRITPASDVWSLGCLLYELLSNQLLFGDLHWSEFFVTLTAGGKVTRSAGDGVVDPTPPPSLPPPRSLRPFAALGCVEALQRLMAAMLVRDPADRPSASRAVHLVDEALAAISSSISKGQTRDSAGSDLSRTTAVGKQSPTHPPHVREQASAPPHTPTSDVHGKMAARSAKFGRNGAERAETETLSQGPDSSGRKENCRVSSEREGQLIAPTALSPAALSTSLRPCMAVTAHRKLDAERSALLGCDWCLHRLGAGAFVLAGPTGGSSGNGNVSPNIARSARTGNQIRASSKNSDQALSAWPQVGPETKVWCSAADRCDDSDLGREATQGVKEAGGSPCTLGGVLPSLGITHVVCVTSRRAGATRARRCSSATKQNASCELHPPLSHMPEGSRFLRVFVSREEESSEGEEGREGPNSSLSGPRSMAGVVRDVVEFATGPRALFVGGDDCNGCGDMAGALALAWAMARTGKGSYETMLDFRQRCAGFYVDAAVIRSVLGHDG